MAVWLADFFTATPWYVLVIIFLCKVVEVSMETVRVILVNRGYRLVGTIISFFELLLWVFVAANVVSDIDTAILKGIIYSLGYAVGVYTGSIIENWLAFGKVMIQIVTPYESQKKLMDFIHGQKLGVTEVDANGYQGKKAILMVFAERKGANKLINALHLLEPQSFIAVNDVAEVEGGFLPRRKMHLLK